MPHSDVFSSITSLPKPQFTEAAYQLILVLKKMLVLKDRKISVKSMLDLISFQSSLDPKQLLRTRIEACIESMEHESGKSLAEMSKEELRDYQQTLSELLSNRVESIVPQNKVIQLLELIGQP